MSGTKSQVVIPRALAGAAGLGAALCAMHTNVIPPTINLDEPDPACDLDYVPNHASRSGRANRTLQLALALDRRKRARD